MIHLLKLRTSYRQWLYMRLLRDSRGCRRSFATDIGLKTGRVLVRVGQERFDKSKQGKGKMPAQLIS